MEYYITVAAAVGFGLAIAATAGAISQSKAIQHALDSIARQPEASGAIQMAMLIGLALIESLVLYVLVISLMLYAKLPPTDKLLKLLEKIGDGGG